MEGINALAGLLQQGKHSIFFGGTGVSTESGIPDFRSADGLYRQKGKVSPENVLRHSFFSPNPKAFYNFYREKNLVPAAVPNAAHFALAELEKKGRMVFVITQNIDGMHQKQEAGR